MAGLAVPLMVGGTLMSAYGQIQGGNIADRVGQYKAAIAKQAGTQDIAASQRQAEDIQRQTDYVASRALAVAAGSGGGASDPTVMNIISQISGEGAYKKAMALYGGQEAARQEEMQAQADIFTGQQEKKASYIGAASTLMMGGSSLYNKYGGGGPKKTGDGLTSFDMSSSNTSWMNP